MEAGVPVKEIEYRGWTILHQQGSVRHSGRQFKRPLTEDTRGTGGCQSSC